MFFIQKFVLMINYFKDTRYLFLFSEINALVLINLQNYLLHLTIY